MPITRTTSQDIKDDSVREPDLDINTPTNGDLLTADSTEGGGWKWLSLEEAGISKPAILEVNASTITAAAANAWVVIKLDEVITNSSSPPWSYSTSNKAVTLDDAGKYRIEFECQFLGTVAGDRVDIRLEVDTGSGYAAAAHKTRSETIPVIGGYAHVGVASNITASAGDKYRLSMRRGAGTGSVIITADSAQMSVTGPFKD